MQWGLVLGALLGALLGELLALFVLEYLRWPRLLDCFLLNLLIVLAYTLPGIVLGLIVAHLVNKAKYNVLIRHEKEPYVVASSWLMGLLLIYGALASPWALIDYPYAQATFVDTFWGMLAWSAVRLFLIFLGSALISRVAYSVLQVLIPRRPPRRRKHTPWGWVAIVGIFPLAMGLVWVHNLNKWPKGLGAPILKPAGAVHPVMVIDWEGADWRVIDPLIEQGRMPHLDSLIRRGVRARVRPDRPALSPIVEANLTTGVSAGSHGISGAVAYEIPLISAAFIPPPYRLGLHTVMEALAAIHVVHPRPVNALDRRASTIWEVASEAGLKIGVMDGPATFPAREIKGHLINANAYPQLLLSVEARPELPIPREAAFTWPPSLMGELVDDFSQARAQSNDLLRRFAVLSPEEAASVQESVYPVKDEPATLLRAAFSRDLFRLRVGRLLWHQTRPAFSYCRVNGINAVQQQFWRYREPEKFLMTPREEIKTFGATMEAYYEWLDDELGGWIEDASDSVNIILVSGHGQGPVFLGMQSRSGGYREGPEGVWVAAGPQFPPQSSEGEAIQVLDIAPTILYLLGLPVSRELPGHVLEGMIDQRLLAESPAQPVERYSLPPSLTVPDSVEPVNQAILKNLWLWGSI